MEDFGNLIYVLAAIGWLVYNGWKAMQKKGAQEKSRRPAGYPANEPAKPAYEAPQPMYEVPQQRKPTVKTFLPGEGGRRTTMMSAHPEENFKEMVERKRRKKSIYSARTNSNQSDKRETIKVIKTRIPGLDEPFNLRKAIIYDTIINKGGYI